MELVYLLQLRQVFAAGLQTRDFLQERVVLNLLLVAQNLFQYLRPYHLKNLHQESKEVLAVQQSV